MSNSVYGKIQFTDIDFSILTRSQIADLSGNRKFGDIRSEWSPFGKGEIEAQKMRERKAMYPMFPHYYDAPASRQGNGEMRSTGKIWVMPPAERGFHSPECAAIAVTLLIAGALAGTIGASLFWLAVFAGWA